MLLKTIPAVHQKAQVLSTVALYWGRAVAGKCLPPDNGSFCTSILSKPLKKKNKVLRLKRHTALLYLWFPGTSPHKQLEGSAAAAPSLRTQRPDTVPTQPRAATPQSPWKRRKKDDKNA